ncbi:MAG: M20/M25/M40 family metallo-hydrolase, partial [Candidatus Bathyarchaeia archaeon]
EPFPVVCRKYEDCQLEILEPSVKTVPCGNAGSGTSVSTPPQGISADLVDAGFGTAKDYERLTEVGVDPNGKIALIERSDRLTFEPYIACRLASDLGIRAVVFATFFSEHTAFRKDAFPSALIPAVSIPYKEAQQLRDKMRKQKVRIRLKNIVEIEENGISCNVIGDLVGVEYPEEVVTITAHHDSWFEGANDNASGVALVLETARLLKKSYKPKRTLRFISFGAEESGSENFFEWAVGSFHYVNKQGGEIKNIVANVNLDAPCYGDMVAVRATPEMTTFVKEIIRDLDLETIFKVLDMPTSWTDHWSFVMAGVPSVNFGSYSRTAYEKIYHTNYDVPLNVSYLLIAPVSEVLLALVKGLDSAEVLPYDFIPTAERLERELASRKAKLKGTVNVSKALEKTRRLKVLARKFNRLKEKHLRGAGLNIDIKVANRLQLETCSLLNRSMIGTGGGTNKEAAWIISEHLDMLVMMKKAVKALQRKNLRQTIAALSSLRTMDWGLNVNLNTYNETFDLMLKRNRYPGIYINAMTELLSLKGKLKKENADVSIELSSIKEKHEKTVREVRKKISSQEVAITKSSKNLMQAISE